MPTPPKGPTSKSTASAPSDKKSKKVGGVTLEVDLKVESPKIRKMEKAQMKRQGFKWAMAAVIFICLAVLLKITIREAFISNPQFSLKQVVVRTQGSLTAQKIVRTSALTTGTNLLTVNMRELQSRLMQLPQVKSVGISRDYEGRLTLEVKQRLPVAWLENSKLGMIAGRADVGHFIDAEGVCFPCEVVTPVYQTLPVIRYEALAQNVPGMALTELPVKSALTLLKELQERTETDVDTVRGIDIHKPYAMTAILADKAQVIFGVDELDEQLTRYDRIRIEARNRQWRVATLNLHVKQNMPVTFREAPNLTGLLDDPVTAAVKTSSTTPKTQSR